MSAGYAKAAAPKARSSFRRGSPRQNSGTQQQAAAVPFLGAAFDLACPGVDSVVLESPRKGPPTPPSSPTRRGRRRSGEWVTEGIPLDMDALRESLSKLGVPPSSARTGRRRNRRRGKGSSSRAREADSEGRRASCPGNMAIEEDTVEDGWRWAEVMGAAPTVFADEADKPRKPKPRNQPVKCDRRARSASPEESGWRWEEIMGACSGGQSSKSALKPASEASETSDHATNAEQALDAGHLQVDGADGGQQEETESKVPELGDLVILGAGAPPECRGQKAVVTKVAEAHCTTVVLDSDGRYGVSECWPCFHDVVIDSRSLRLNTRVVVDGLQGMRTRRLNGFSGRIVAHPREGHPTFIRKPSAPDKPQLTVVIAFDDPESAGEKTVLLEPRFVVDYDEYIARMARGLDEVLAAARSSQQQQQEQVREQQEQQGQLPEGQQTQI